MSRIVAWQLTTVMLGIPVVLWLQPSAIGALLLGFAAVAIGTVIGVRG